MIRESSSAVTTRIHLELPDNNKDLPTSKAYNQPEHAAFKSKANACGTPRSLAKELAIEGTG